MRGPDYTTYHHRQPATPYMAGHTGSLCPAPSAARVDEYHSTTPSSTPFHGRSGCGGACHAPDRLVLIVVTSSPTPSPIPSSARAVLADLHWCATMEEEYGALISNGAWELVPRPQGSNVVTGK
jgi:hypothetical protein